VAAHENGMLAMKNTALGSVNYAVQLSSNAVTLSKGYCFL